VTAQGGESGQSGRTGEELRRRALALLADQGDRRAIDLLSRADLSVAWAAARWGSSHGPVDGHAVTLVVDAFRLGQLRANPALYDAICAALASAIATQPGESLLALTVRWSPDAPHAEAAAYRDAPPPRVTLAEALGAYLEGSGSIALAGAVRGTTVERAGVTDVVVRDLSDDAAASLPELTRAARDLLDERSLRVRREH
jgi:hypothetical protein